MSKLEEQLKAACKGEIIEVKNHKQRAEAHRIAMREGFKIITRANIFGKGFQVIRG